MQPTDANDIELKASLEEFLLDLLSDAVKTNVASWEDGIPLRHCHGHDVTGLTAKTKRWLAMKTTLKTETRWMGMCCDRELSGT